MFWIVQSRGGMANNHQYLQVIIHQGDNRSYVWLRHMLKINHQASFTRNFLKPLAPYCFHEGIPSTFAALGIYSKLCIYILKARLLSDVIMHTGYCLTFFKSGYWQQFATKTKLAVTSYVT